MANDKTDFTQGSILKKLVAFMIPVLGALILQAAYGAVDLLVVGRYGSTSGLSAVSTGSQVLNLVTFVVTQLAMGITVLIGRYLGEKHLRSFISTHGIPGTSDCHPDAGTKRSSNLNSKLHPHLWLRNLFYRSIQCIICHIQRAWRQ